MHKHGASNRKQPKHHSHAIAIIGHPAPPSEPPPMCQKANGQMEAPGDTHDRYAKA